MQISKLSQAAGRVAELHLRLYTTGCEHAYYRGLNYQYDAGRTYPYRPKPHSP